MLNRKQKLSYSLICLSVTLLQTLTNAFQNYSLTFFLSCLLYFAFGLLIQHVFTRINVWVIYLVVIPYSLLLIATGFYLEDISDLLGILVSLSLAIWVKKGESVMPLKVAGFFFWLGSLFFFTLLVIPGRAILSNSVERNKPFPTFLLTDQKGEKVSTAQWKGKVVLIEMWYTQCGACIKQIKATQKIQDHFKNDPEIVFSAINCGYDSWADINKFSSGKPFLTNIHLDQDTAITKYLKYNAFPKVLILDKSGNLRLEIDGFSQEWETEYQQKVISVLETLAKE